MTWPWLLITAGLKIESHTAHPYTHCDRLWRVCQIVLGDSSLSWNQNCGINSSRLIVLELRKFSSFCELWIWLYRRCFASLYFLSYSLKFSFCLIYHSSLSQSGGNIDQYNFIRWHGIELRCLCWISVIVFVRSFAQSCTLIWMSG